MQIGFRLGRSGDHVVVGTLNNQAHPEEVSLILAYDGAWAIDQMLFAPDAKPGDEFGTPVDIDGDTLAVGARRAATSLCSPAR